MSNEKKGNSVPRTNYDVIEHAMTYMITLVGDTFEVSISAVAIILEKSKGVISFVIWIVM